MTDNENEQPKRKRKHKASRFILFCANHSTWYAAFRSVASVVVNAAIFGLGTNLLSDYYKSRGAEAKALVWIGIILAICLIAAIAWVIDYRVSNAEKENEKQEGLKNCAIRHLSKVDTTEQELIVNNSVKANNNVITHRALAEICYRNIQNTLEACYSSIHDYHSNCLADDSQRIADKFDLTVNFMTESYIYSYKDDDGNSRPAITIAAWKNFNCNKEPSGRHALSSDPQFYLNTEAAKMYYGGYKKEITIISSTEESRITINKDDVFKMQSMVVAPVLAQSNELIGTLVIHCNEENFFQESNKAFFDTLLKIFTESIKKDKVLLDALMQNKDLRNELKKENSFAIF